MIFIGCLLCLSKVQRSKVFLLLVFSQLKAEGRFLSECIHLLIFFFQWKRSLTDVDMKRRKNEQRERSRMDINIIEQITSPTLSFELENFKFYGKLNKTETEIHNTLPSLESKFR